MDSSAVARGYINLDKALLDFNAWEKQVAHIVKENAELKTRVKALERQCVTHEKVQAESQAVANEYLSMMERLQSTLLTQCDMEAENVRMKEALAEAKEQQKLLESRHSRELKSALYDLEAAQEAHKVEVAVVQDSLTEQKRFEIESLQKMVQARTSENKALLKQIADGERDRQHEMVKLRLECDSKILQLQKQQSSSSSSSSSSSGAGLGPTMNSDIFRKKLQHMRQESTREISNLKQVISDLERKLAAQTKGRRR